MIQISEQDLTSNTWVDIQGGLAVASLREYLNLWNLIALVQLHAGREDTAVWLWTASEVHSAVSKVSLQALFHGATSWNHKRP